MNNRKGLIALALSSTFLFSATTMAKTIEIGIGHQSMVTNTVSGGVILEKLKLIEKHLPTTGQYEKAKYKIVFRDYDSGPPITNQMLASKLDFGVMGDYPLIVNGANFQATKSQETRFIAVTGYNLKGTGNAIVVPYDSPAQSLADLAGKNLSVPVGSAAWGMTLKALRDADLYDKVRIVNQSPPVGVANIAAGRIDAHADFCPWSEIMEFRGTARKIFDGSETGVPTFHGIVVREAFAKEHPEIVEAVLMAMLEAQQWIQSDPVMAATKVSEWTGVDKEVLYLYFSQGGISTMEASVKPQWVESLKYSHALLQREMQIPDLNFDAWIDDSYLKRAYARAGMDYDAMVQTVVSSEPGNPGLPAAEMWVEGQGVQSFPSIAEMLAAAEAAGSAGSKVNATYVYDNTTGLKLFGKTAYMVRDEAGEVVAFMKKSDSEQYIATHGGTALLKGNFVAMLP